MLILFLFLFLSSPCYGLDCSTPSCPIPQPPNCNPPSAGCNTNQQQSSQNAVIGGSPSAGINFNGSNNNGGDWAPIPGQLAWPQLAFNGSLPIKDGMYMPPQIILQYKNNFSMEDARKMSNRMKVVE